MLPDRPVSPNFAAAIHLGSLGVHIFPTQVEGEKRKQPVPGLLWRQRSSADKHAIEAMWRMHREAAPAIDVAKTDFVIIDCDAEKPGKHVHGVAWFRAECERHEFDLSTVPIVATPSGGWHVYFKQPAEGERLGNSRGSLPAKKDTGVDVRGSGGYVLAPGGEIDIGRYELLEGLEISEAPEAPSWLVDMLRGKRAEVADAAPAPVTVRTAPMAVGSSRLESYVDEAFRREVLAVATTGDGGRNIRLNQAAFSLGQLVAGGVLSEGEVWAALRGAAEANGLAKDDGPRSVNATIRSGLRGGKAHPRTGPEDDGAAGDLAHGAMIARRLLARAESGELVDQETGKIVEAGGRPVDLGLPYDPWAEFSVPAFPLDALPAPIAAFVEQNARHIGACPSALALAALGACSAAIDHRWSLAMQRHGSWKVSPRLWVLLVGDPSRKKSPVINAALAPIEEYERAARDAYHAEIGNRPEGAPEPEKPTRYVVGDVTVEKLGDILSRQSRGVLVKRDELSGWIGSMEKYAGGKGSAADRAFWLKAFDGGAFMIDRIQRGELWVSNLSVSLIGGIQPARLAEMHGLSSDGLLQRFIPVMMSAPHFPDDQPAGHRGSSYDALVSSLLELPLPLPTGLNGIRSVVFSDDARPIVEKMQRHLFDLEQTSGGLASGFQGFVGKLAGLYGSLCLVLHLAENVRGGRLTHVSAETAANAARIVRDFVLPHAFEFYRSSETSTDGDRLQKIASWLLTSGKTRFVASDFTTNVACLRGLGLFDLAKALSPLVAGGWLHPMEPGPTPRRWSLSPAVPTHFAARAKEEETRKQRLAELMNGRRR